VREPKVSIIVAAMNEADTISLCINRILAVFHDNCEILVVTGGTDATADIVADISLKHPNVRLIQNANDRGKGHAIKVGISHAKAPIHAQIDADLQFMPEELPRLIQPIENGQAHVVLGSRFTRGSKRLPGSTPFIRTLGNKAVSAFASVLFLQRMTDVQAGMKAWSADAIEIIQLASDNYSYEVEIPAKGLLKGLKVVDMPITTDSRQGGATNVQVFKAGLALLRDITAFRLGIK